MSPRGAIVKQIGEQAAVVADDDGDYLVRFHVTEIDNPYECTGYDETAENGQFIGVWLSVTTEPDLAESPYPYFDLGDWMVVDADGKRQNANPRSGSAMMCPDSNDALGHGLDPGLSASGVIVLDVATSSGSIILNHGGTPAWEWPYGN